MKAVRAKKLGQHFLVDLNIAQKLADTLTFNNYDSVLEVGPGMGVLTQFLIQKTAHLHVIEIDSESVLYLKKHYTEDQFKLIEGDFLKLNLQEYFTTKPLALIGNFPYNISTQILFKTIENRSQIPFFAGMFQKKLQNVSVNLPGQKSMEFSLFLHNFFTILNYFLQYLLLFLNHRQRLSLRLFS